MTDLLNLTHAERIRRARPADARAWEAHLYGELAYRLHDEDATMDDEDACWVYSPAGVLTVDGVTYRRAGENYERPMIRLIDDLDDGWSSPARMRHDRPPSQAELDYWVRHGSNDLGWI